MGNKKTGNTELSKMQGKKGIALITVLIIVIVLGVLSVFALNELGYNVINAGNKKNAEYAYNTSNATINAIIPFVISGGTITGLNLGPISSMQVGSWYYTTYPNTITGPAAYKNLDASNLLSVVNSNNILPNSQAGSQIGFEYTVNCGRYQTGILNGNPVYSYNYTGFLYAISRFGSTAKIEETMVEFNTAGQDSIPSNCNSASITISDDTQQPPTTGFDLLGWFQISR